MRFRGYPNIAYPEATLAMVIAIIIVKLGTTIATYKNQKIGTVIFCIGIGVAIYGIVLRIVGV